jgi:large subunit ribosomal protein L30
MYVILRVRGHIGVKTDIEDTLKLLNLTRPNHCVLYPETDYIKGMLKKSQNYITWGKISPDMLAKLISKRGKAYNEENKLVKVTEVYKNIDEVVEKILNNEKLKNLKIKPVFRLKPPSKGYERKGIKKTYKQGGALGYRAEDINILLKKMI